MQFVDTNSDDRAFIIQTQAPVISNWLQLGLRTAYHAVCEAFRFHIGAVQACEHSNTIHTCWKVQSVSRDSR